MTWQMASRWVSVVLLMSVGASSMAEQIHDKTLVVWTAPANLEQHGGSALTLDDGAGHFDGVVFGELEPQRWMAGSDTYNRTERRQVSWPKETSRGTRFVQIAIVYKSAQVTILRNGEVYASYAHETSSLAFPQSASVILGRRHLDAADKENSFVGAIKDARIYDRALTVEEVQSLKPGEALGTLKPWAWWSFADQGLREVTGRFTEIELIGDVKVKSGSLVLGGSGASVVFHQASDPSLAGIPKTWSKDGPVPEEVVRSSRQLREKLLADPYRPGYHFCVPEDMGIPGDPNGAFYYQGRYHLMYLYNRSGVGFCWGHVSSSDLVHWRHHPDAIGPGHGDEGCFSGGAFIDNDGTAYLSYWMLWGAKGIGLASSKGPDFDVWTKLEANPVIPSTEWGVTEMKDPQGKPVYLGSADPSNIWKHNGRYFMLTGNLLVLNKVGRSPDSPLSEQGDRLYLFESKDLKAWTFKHVFYQRDPKWTDRSEDNMCPSFLPLPLGPEGGSPSDRHLLLFISHNKGCQYYVGRYLNDVFLPDNHGCMTWIDNTYFAPEALIDGKGRQIMWAWLTDNPEGEKERGWSGVYGLPRTLWLGEDGTLRMRPVKELEALRGKELSWTTSLQPQRLEGIRGDSFELDAEIEMGESRVAGLQVRASADGKERTLVYYDSTTHELTLNSLTSGSDGRRVIERAPFELAKGEKLHLRVFVDKSVVEVYANDRQAICRRVYPQASSLGVSMFSEGASIQSAHIRAWEMEPSNPY